MGKIKCFGKRWLFICLPMFLYCGCEEIGNDWESMDGFRESKQALSVVCSISLGGGGETEVINLYEGQPSVLQVNTSANWDFIRQTTGPCHFVVYNGTDGTGSYVNLGSDLNDKIRAGEDGVRYKDEGGGNTWKIRSVKIVKFFNWTVS